jgi:hopanoid biosynthesis associated RND transporter like protein HpnN
MSKTGFREKTLSRWGELSAKYSFLILAIFIIVTIFSLILAMDLRISTRWSDLLPKNDPLVEEFESIVEDYTSTANSILVVWGPEDDIKTFAEYVVPQIEELDSLVKRVDYKIDEEFIRRHGFMLTKTKDLKNMVKVFEDLDLTPFLRHINDNFEETYIGDEESLSDKEKENGAIQSLDGLQFWIETMSDFIDSKRADSALAAEAVDRFLLGDPYFISHDKRMLLIFIEPTFDITDVDPMVLSTDLIQDIIDEALNDFHDVSAGLTGTIPLSRDEMYYSMKDLETSSVLALVLVLLLFIFSFRMITAPLLAALNLMISVMFASGIISLFVDELNLMTSMFAVILIGLGIDFSIHIISLYMERRTLGDDISQAMPYTLSHSGAGIITGALTTAMAFITLTVSDTPGIREFGLVLGIGIIAVMFATLIVLPSLLISQERIRLFLHNRLRRNSREKLERKSIQFGFLGNIGEGVARKPSVTLISAIIVTALLLISALNIKYDYNYMNMEPKGIPSVTLQDSLEKAFEMSPDFAMVTTTTVEESREIAEKAKKVPSVSYVETISDFVPQPEDQENRLFFINQIRTYLTENRTSNFIDPDNIEQLTGELERLDMNIYEFGQMAFIGGQDRVDQKCSMIVGNPVDEKSQSKIINLVDKINNDPQIAATGLNIFQKMYIPVLRKKALHMADTSRISIESLPGSILNRFLNEKGDKFLITITPEQQIWNYEFLERFTEQMERISEKITGTPRLFLRLTELFARDGTRAVILTILTVFILLLIDFRSIKSTLMAMLPLVAGAVWMVGLMNLLGLQLTFINLMGIPMIIGIGIDDGVHILHRYRIEGRENTRTVMRSTGRAVLLTSLTTMAGFGSLMIAKYRGFMSLSSLLVIGVGVCFITSVVFLPALMNLGRKKKI